MENLGLDFGLLLTSFAAVQSACGPGTFYSPGDGSCNPCPRDQYQTEIDHNNTDCRRCTPYDELDPLATLLQSCTRQNDIIVGCIEGFYDANGCPTSDPDCRVCTNCARLKKIVGKNCSTYQDAECCPKGMIFDGNSNCCKKDLLFCDAGFYLVPGNTSTGDTCKPCGGGYTVEREHHRQRECDQKSNTAPKTSGALLIHIIIIELYKGFFY